MKNIIGAIVVVVCIVAGAIGGNFLNGGGGADAAATHDDGHAKEAKDSHAKDSHGKDSHGGDSHGKSAKKKDGHGGGYGGGDGSYYYKFSREFVVPIMREGRVKSLVILNINLEADNSISQELFSMEPKLRDNIMTTLVTLSNDGATLENITDPESYETIRSMVLYNLKDVINKGIKNVLILDMAVQNM